MTCCNLVLELDAASILRLRSRPVPGALGGLSPTTENDTDLLEITERIEPGTAGGADGSNAISSFSSLTMAVSGVLILLEVTGLMVFLTVSACISSSLGLSGTAALPWVMPVGPTGSFAVREAE